MIGGKCTIRGTGIVGLVVGQRLYVGDAARYTVRFFAGGCPQEREFTEAELSFGEQETNVVALSAVRRAA